MPTIIGDLRPAHWDGGSFRPTGKVEFVGNKAHLTDDLDENPLKSSKSKVYAVRFFIGFNVGGKQRWHMDDLRKLVKKIRVRQMGQPDASFIAQTGMYTSDSPSGRARTVTEHGAQLYIVNVKRWRIPPNEFRAQMIELGEELCKALNQELIIGEWQENGIIQQNWEITP